MDPENAEMATLANEGVVGWLNVRIACLFLISPVSRIWQKLTREALLIDYPWGKLGSVTVVDLGCGAGDSGIDVLMRYPDLKWVFQDFGPVLEGVKKVCVTSVNHAALEFAQANLGYPSGAKGRSGQRQDIFCSAGLLSAEC